MSEQEMVTVTTFWDCGCETEREVPDSEVPRRDGIRCSLSRRLEDCPDCRPDDFSRLYRNIIGPLTRLAGEMEGASRAATHSDIQALADTIDGWSTEAMQIRDAVAEELDFPTAPPGGSSGSRGGE